MNGGDEDFSVECAVRAPFRSGIFRNNFPNLRKAGRSQDGSGAKFFCALNLHTTCANREKYCDIEHFDLRRVLFHMVFNRTVENCHGSFTLPGARNCGQQDA
jgi:hypothetical protein